MSTTTPTEPPQGSADAAITSHELGRRARTVLMIAWSGFLAAALATMLCFAFIDPLALSAGEPPAWWSTRLNVYAVGFFFFWLIGVVSAALCQQLSRPAPGGSPGATR